MFRIAKNTHRVSYNVMIGGRGMDISNLQPIGRKAWVKKRWDAYEDSRNTKAIERSKNAYYDPTIEEYDDKIDKSKWKSTVDRKVNYLLARKPIVNGNQDILDSLLPFIRETACAYTLRGSLIWIVQGDGEDILPKPTIMSDTIAIYSDEHREDVIAYIRKYVDIDIEPLTGEETENSYYEVYYETNGAWHRDTYSYDLDNRDSAEVLSQAPVFIELGKTGDAPLYAYVEELLEAFDHMLVHQDTAVEKNTKPLTEVRGYTGTSDADLQYAIDELSIVKVDGNGGVAVHTRQMDSAAIDLWSKRLMQEYYEATATVGKDNELQYAISGKAMDRLFVDMENAARELAEVLETALIAYFEVLGYQGVDIIWNTDRPIDDTQIINGIQASRGLVSDRTLLEQHPWVDDIEKEMLRREEEANAGMLDLIEDEDASEETEWEVDE